MQVIRFLLLFFVGCFAAFSVHANPVQIGDLVQVNLPGEESLNRGFQVDKNGRINLPEVGPTYVAGYNEEQLASVVSKAMANVLRDVNNLRVFVAKKQVIISVQGYVRSPGEYTLTDSSTVQMALFAAGGLRPGAQLDQLQLKRGPKTIVFNYKHFLDTGDGKVLPPLQSLDSIFVPASPLVGNIEQEFDPAKLANSGDSADSRSAIKVFGEVNAPGSFSYKEGTDLVDIIMRSGGVTRFASVEQIRVISNEKPTLFNLKRYLDTGDSSLMPELTAGSTVFVPKMEEEIKAGANTVYVMGEVAQPGAFEGNKGATFMDILANAGGPTRFAESRQIRVLRANGDVIRFDLTAYTEGIGASTPPVIQPGDAIFVPEKTDMNEASWLKVSPDRAVNILGEVTRPGRVEWSDEMDLIDLLAHVGGPTLLADTTKIEIATGDGKATVFDLDAFIRSGAPRNELPQIKSGAVIRLSNTGSAGDTRTSIKIFGEVNEPGSFRFKENTSLVDVIMRSGGVTRYASVEQIRIISNNTPTLFNLKRYLDSGDASLLPELTPGATIFVPKMEEEIKAGSNTVYVMGEVAKPGAFEQNKGATFMDILANAGGPTRFAEARNIRVLKSDGKVIRFNLSAYTEGLSNLPPPVIEPGDAIFIPEKTDINEKSWLKIPPNQVVHVIGEVVRPGRIEWSDEMDLMDLLAHVGGPTLRADTTKLEIANGRGPLQVFDLDAFIKNGAPQGDLPLINAGTIVRVHDLPQDPSDNKSQWVRQSSDASIYVFGQVNAPGRYRFTTEMHFLDILSAADGPTKDADIHNIRVTHRDKPYAKVSKLNLSLYFETGDESILPVVLPGDTIYIPEKDKNWLDRSKETTVRVLGAVRNPGRYVFDDNMTILDLLAEAGGPTEFAYLEKISVVNLSCCQNQARTFDLIEFSKTAEYRDLPVIRTGDTVYIPHRRDSFMEKARNSLDDVLRIATAIALIGAL